MDTNKIIFEIVSRLTRCGHFTELYVRQSIQGYTQDLQTQEEVFKRVTGALRRLGY